MNHEINLGIDPSNFNEDPRARIQRGLRGLIGRQARWHWGVFVVADRRRNIEFVISRLYETEMGALEEKFQMTDTARQNKKALHWLSNCKIRYIPHSDSYYHLSYGFSELYHEVNDGYI